MTVTEQGAGFRIETDPGTTLDELAREYTMAVLKKNGGSRLKTALALGVALNTVYQRLKRYRAERASTP